MHTILYVWLYASKTWVVLMTWKLSMTLKISPKKHPVMRDLQQPYLLCSVQCQDPNVEQDKAIMLAVTQVRCVVG